MIGKQVLFSKRFLNFSKRSAWDWCTVAGQIVSEAAAEDYLKMRLLGLGLPYKATVTGYGCDKNTYKIDIEVLGLKDSVFVDRRSIRLRKKKG
jgi:hypothetical protein